MRKLALLVFAMLISIISIAQNEKQDFIEIYYFHRTERCATCNSIEEGISSTLERYKKEISKGDLVFMSLNFEEDKDSEIIKIYEIESPTLLLIYNNKGEKKFLDLTEEAFSNALRNPSKFKKTLRKSINRFFR